MRAVGRSKKALTCRALRGRPEIASGQQLQIVILEGQKLFNRPCGVVVESWQWKALYVDDLDLREDLTDHLWVLYLEYALQKT